MPVITASRYSGSGEVVYESQVRESSSDSRVLQHFFVMRLRTSLRRFVMKNLFFASLLALVFSLVASATFAGTPAASHDTIVVDLPYGSGFWFFEDNLLCPPGTPRAFTWIEKLNPQI